VKEAPDSETARLPLRHEEPRAEDLEFLEERLHEFNRDATGMDDGRGLGLFLRDAAGQIQAAAAGYTWAGLCELRQVWVAPELRGRGLGRRLLVDAEAEARRRGCHQLLLTIHSFQAPGFYRKLGFEVVAEVPDHPPGHSQLTLRKWLAAEPGGGPAR